MGSLSICFVVEIDCSKEKDIDAEIKGEVMLKPIVL